MKKSSKVLALILSLVMIFSAMPTLAFAEMADEKNAADAASVRALNDAAEKGDEDEIYDIIEDITSRDTADHNYGEVKKASKNYTVQTAVTDDGEGIDFIQMSDVHVFSELLIENASRDYREDVLLYNKVLGETFPILNATFTAIEKDVREKHLRYVFITGDLTSNGEYNNHVMLATFLRSFQEQMRKKYDPQFHVFVINGNHDINLYNGTFYDKNGKVVLGSSSKEAADSVCTTSASFAEIYYDLGYGEDDDDCGLNVTYYKDSIGLNKRGAYTFADEYANLSYSADLTTGDGTKMKLIAFDSSEYSPDAPDAEEVTVAGEKRQGQYTGCYMSPAHLNWIKNECSKAKENGQVVIGMSHYAVLPHFTLQSAVLRMFIYPDWENLCSELADAGMHYTLSGHMHCNDVGSYTNTNGETIYDIETGALSGSFPQSFREVSFDQNDDGSVKCTTQVVDCDRDAQVDLSKCYYSYNEDGTPDYSTTIDDINALNPDYIKLKLIENVEYTTNKNLCDLSHTNVDENGNPYGKISKPFMANYGIYAFMGGRTKATADGDAESVIIPSIKQMAGNMVDGYLNGKTYQQIMANGGLKGLLSGILGSDLDQWLTENLPEEVTFSVITFQRSDIISLADELIDKINAAYLADNTTLRTAAQTLIDQLLNYEIAGYTLNEIATQCLIAHYTGDEASVAAGTNAKLAGLYTPVDMDKVYDEITDNNKTIHELIDYLVNLLLYGKDEEGNPISLVLSGKEIGKSKGILFDLLDGITINADEVYKVLPDFAGILQYPTIRQLVLGTDAKEVPVVTIVNKWAGKIVKDSYEFKDFTTGKTQTKNVTDTASLIEYFIFGTVDDFLNESQLTIVSDLLVTALASFNEDPCFSEKGTTHGDYVVNPYDLIGSGVVSGNDNQNEISYKKLAATVPTVENYMLPNTISVSFGSDTATTKKFNWFTRFRITGSDIQIIPYKANATEADFTSEDLVNVNVTKDEKDGLTSLVYPTLDIGVYTCSEGKTMYRHAITVSGLEAGKKYTYRVGDAAKGYWSAPAAMETAQGDNSPFTFIGMSDNQGQTKAQYEESVGTVMKAVKSSYPEAKFIVQAGDMVDYGANMRQWSWALGVDGMTDYTIASTSGNHEPKGNGKGNLLNAGFSAAQDTYYNIDKGSAPADQDTADGLYYDFDYNDVHFMVINTNDLNSDNTLSDAQVEWLKKSCQSTDKTWKILTMHKSIYSNASHYDDKDVVALRAQLSKLFPQLGIDVVLSGHDHVILSTNAINDGNVSNKFDESGLITNAGGTVYTIAGKAGIKTYKVKDKTAVDELFGFSDYFASVTTKGELNELYTYSAVKVDGDTLTVTINAAKADGSSEEVYSYNLKKSKLNAPTSVKAQAQDMSSIKVSWIKSADATSYDVYRSEAENGTYEKIGTTSSTSYIDSSVKAGNKYFYKVVAGTTAGAASSMKSAFSKVASAKAGPAPVSGLKASMKTKTSIQLSWSKVKGAESYNVYFSDSKNGEYKLAGSSNTINAVISDLSSGTYFVKVSAVQDGIEGEASAVREVTLS